MNILMIGANPDNATDGVIVRGVYQLLGKAFVHFTLNTRYRILNDIVQQLDSDFEEYDYDVIVVCGTPWLWDSFQLSQKYKNLLRCFELNPKAKKVFLGAGSCLSLNADSSILCRPEEVEGIKKLYTGTTVVARDYLAHEKFLNAGIESVLLPCPAYFCYGAPPGISNKTTNILVWTDPRETISSVDWQDTDRLNTYHQEVLEFFRLHKPEVYCTDSRCVKGAVDIGLPRPTILTHHGQTTTLMRRANKVLSGRVHCAVPAIVQQAEVKLLALDSRSRVVYDFSHIDNFSPYIKDYVNILRSLT